MTRRASPACFAILLLATACATAPRASTATVQRDSTATAQRGSTAVWAHSGEAAAGLDFAFIRPGAVDAAQSDRSGIVRPPAGGSLAVHVTTQAYPGYAYDLSDLSGTLEIAEPVRVTGKIAAIEGGGRLRLRAGYGPHEPVLERHHFERTPPPRGENRFLGIELPLSASQWIDVRIADDGSFTTPWLPAVDTIQLVASDARWNVAIHEILIPRDVRPGQTFTAPLALQAMQVLDLTTPTATRETPLALTAAVRLADVAESRRAEVAKYLSLVDQVDDQLFEFSAGRLPLPLDDNGHTRIAGLPLYDSVELVVSGPIPGMVVKREVALESDLTTAVKIEPDELIARPASSVRRTLRGSVRLEGSNTPLKGAKVVYSDYPERLETVTDAGGNFELRDVPHSLVPTFFVDAQTTAPDGYARTFVFRMRAADVNRSEPVTLTLPRDAVAPGSSRGALGPPVPRPPAAPEWARFAPTGPAPRLSIPGCIEYETTEQYPVCQGWRRDPVSGEFLLGNVLECIYDDARELVGVRVLQDEPGEWNFLVSITPFVVATAEGIAIEGEYAEAPVQGSEGGQAFLSVFFPNGREAEGIQIQIPSYVVEPDPVDAVTPESGQIFIQCINNREIYAYVDTPLYYFEGSVRFNRRNLAIITLWKK